MSESKKQTCHFCGKVGATTGPIDAIVIQWFRFKIFSFEPDSNIRYYCCSLCHGQNIHLRDCEGRLKNVLKDVSNYDPIPRWAKYLTSTNHFFHNDISCIILNYCLEK
jgi:hypothetical protein